MTQEASRKQRIIQHFQLLSSCAGEAEKILMAYGVHVMGLSVTVWSCWLGIT